MITLSVTVTKRVADWTPNVSLPQIYAGATNVDMIKFTFDSEWNDYTNKRAQLSDGQELWEVALDEHGCADIPPKITEKPCFMKIGVSAKNKTGQTISTSLLTYQIGKGSAIKSFYGDAAFKSLNEKIDLIMEMRSLGAVESEYYLSDNPASVSDSAAWSIVSQTPTTNMPYLWHRLKFCYTNGDIDYTEPSVICSKGDRGTTFFPSVSSSGIISWTNDGNMLNPTSVNIKGPKGDPGVKGITFTPSIDSTGLLTWTNDGNLANPSPVNVKDGPAGHTFTPSVSSEGIISWTNNGNLTNPPAVNIKGPKGDKGETGEAGADNTAWSYVSQSSTTNLQPKTFYYLGTKTSSFSYSLAGGTAGAEWGFCFETGSKVPEITHPSSVKIQDFKIKENQFVEVSIRQVGAINKWLVSKAWDLS